MTQTLIAWGIVAVLLVTALSLVWGIRRNLSEGERTRSALLKRLLDSRLSGLMQVMGINPRGYLSHALVVDVERQLRVCQVCPHQRQCTEDLSTAADEGHFAYCPVYPALMDAREALVGV